MSGKALAGKCSIMPFPNYSGHETTASQVITTFNSRPRGDDPLGQNLSRRMFRTNVLRGRTQTYGDIDFVVDGEYLTECKVTPQKLAGILGSEAWAENGQVWSFEFSGHQIDFIRVPNYASLSLSSILYGTGGAGYLLRFLLRPYGLRLRDDGLKEVLYDGNRKISEIMIGYDSGSILTFLGISYSGSYNFRYSRYNSIEEAYSEIVNSPFFTLCAFDINENYEYIGKPERLEYPPFRGFVEYVRGKAATVNAALQRRTPTVIWPLTPTAAQKGMLTRKLRDCHEYHLLRRAALEDYRRDLLLRSKFSGEVAMEATGLKPGVELGRFMEYYKDSFGGRGAFEFHILSSTPDTIQESMKGVYADYRKAEDEKLAALPVAPLAPTIQEGQDLPKLSATKRSHHKKVDLDPPF